MRRGEVLGKLDLKGDRPSVLGVRDQEIYACVFRGNPHVPFRVVLLYVRSDEVLTSVDCEKWFHLLVGERLALRLANTDSERVIRVRLDCSELRTHPSHRTPRKSTLTLITLFMFGGLSD